MKIREILAEYDRSKTAQQMSSTIATSAERESQLRNLEPHQQADAVLEKAEAADPTPNKKYVLWIVRQFVKNELKFEDINEFLKKDIIAFHELPKQRKQQLGIETDLNKYTWRDLREIAIKLEKATDLEEPVDANLDYEHIDDMKVLYVGDMGQLIIPETEAASCEIGRGTRWCTAATESDNEFSYYASDGPLYVWIPSRKMPEKKISNKFQFHFESVQFMDENDKQIESDLIRYFRTKHPVVKNAFAKGERVIAQQSAYHALHYARYMIKGRFPEGEAAIAQSAHHAYYYAVKVIEGRFPEGEPAIAKDDAWAHRYALHAIEGRFPEGEAAIAQSAHHAHQYARYVIKGRFPEGEAAIAEDTHNAYYYAVKVIEGRWPEGEAAIAQDPEWAYRYALHAIEGRFPEGEPAIAKDPDNAWAYHYARYVIEGRWPEPHRDEAERNIRSSSAMWEDYVKLVKQSEKIDEDISSATDNEYDELTQKNFAHKSQQVVDLANQSKQALQAFYPNGELKTMKSGTGNFVTQWYETPEEIFLIGINTKSGRLLKNDIADVKTFIDMLITAMQSGKTLITSPHKKSLSMLNNVQKIAEKRGLNFSMDVSDSVSFGEGDPELEFFQVQAEIN